MILGYDGDVICLLCGDVSENEKSHCITGGHASDWWLIPLNLINDKGREKHMMRWRRAKDRSKMKSVCVCERERVREREGAAGSTQNSQDFGECTTRKAESGSDKHDGCNRNEKMA